MERKSEQQSQALNWKTKGNDFFKQNLMTKAIECYEKAIVINPSFKEAWLNKGLCLHKLKQTQASLAALQEAINIDPLYTKAVFNKVSWLLRLKQFSAVRHTIEEYKYAAGNSQDILSLQNKCLTYITLAAKTYLYVKQGHICRWQYDPNKLGTYDYGFYTEKFFNCLIILLRSQDHKKIVMIHADQSISIDDIKDSMQWVGNDCEKILYVKEHKEGQISLDDLFAHNKHIQKRFNLIQIKAKRHRGKIIPCQTVASLPDGSLAPEFENDVIWLDHTSHQASQYNDFKATTDNDKMILKIYQQLQLRSWKTFANGRGKAYTTELQQAIKKTLRRQSGLHFELVKKGDYGNLRSQLDIGLGVNTYLALNTGNYTLLALAATEGQEAIVDLLISRGANINKRILLTNNTYGGTALFFASGRGQIRIVTKLLAIGANPFIATDAGATPLTIAKQQKHSSAVLLLENFISKQWEAINTSTQSNSIFINQAPLYKNYIKATQGGTVRFDKKQSPPDINGLATDGLFGCLAIIMINKKRNRFSLTHTPLSVSTEAFVKECQWLGEACIVYLIRGVSYRQKGFEEQSELCSKFLPRIASAFNKLAFNITINDTAYTSCPGSVAIDRNGSITCFSPGHNTRTLFSSPIIKRIGITAPAIEPRHAINLVNQTALAIIEKCHPLDIQYNVSHWTHFPALNQQANLLVSQFQQQKALELPFDIQQELMVCFIYQEQKNHVFDANKKAVTLFENKEYDRALSHYQEILALSKTLWGDDTQYVATVHANIAACYECKEDYKQAYEHYSQCHDIRQRLFGKQAPQTLKIAQSMDRLTQQSETINLTL